MIPKSGYRFSEKIMRKPGDAVIEPASMAIHLAARQFQLPKLRQL
jgi:hypothetical protein